MSTIGLESSGCRFCRPNFAVSVHFSSDFRQWRVWKKSVNTDLWHRQRAVYALRLFATLFKLSQSDFMLNVRTHCTSCQTSDGRKEGWIFHVSVCLAWLEVVKIEGVFLQVCPARTQRWLLRKSQVLIMYVSTRHQRGRCCFCSISFRHSRMGVLLFQSQLNFKTTLICVGVITLLM